MRMRTLKLSIGLMILTAICGLAFFCACGVKYTADFKEAYYVVDTYENNDIFTQSSTFRVTYSKPAEGTAGFVTYCDSYVNCYFIFENLDVTVEKVKFLNVANEQPLFDVYVDGLYSKNFSLSTTDWNSGCNVNGTNIKFVTTN